MYRALQFSLIPSFYPSLGSPVSPLFIYPPFFPLFSADSMYALDLSTNGGNRDKAATKKTVESSSQFKSPTHQVATLAPTLPSSPALSMLNCYYSSWLLSMLSLDNTIHRTGRGDANSTAVIDLAMVKTKTNETASESLLLTLLLLMPLTYLNNRLTGLSSKFLAEDRIGGLANENIYPSKYFTARFEIIRS